MHAAREYGVTEPGHVIGAFKQSKGDGNVGTRANGVPLLEGREETSKGAAKLDRSILIRAAGMSMDDMGWTREMIAIGVRLVGMMRGMKGFKN